MTALSETTPAQSASDLVLGRLDAVWRTLEPEVQRPAAVTTLRLMDFVKAEAHCLDAGTPDAMSSGRFYDVVHAIYIELGVDVTNVMSRMQALEFIVSRLREALQDCPPAYHEWLASLSVTDYVVHRVNARMREKMS